MLQHPKNVIPSHEPARRADLFEAVLDAVPAGVALLRGSELVFEVVSPRLLALGPMSQALGRRFADVWPEAADRLAPALQAVLVTGERYCATDVELPIRRSIGGPLEPAWFAVEVQRLRGSAGEADAVLASLVETTGSVRSRLSAEAAAEGAARAMKRAELLANLAADLNRGIDLPSVLETTLVRVHELLRFEDGSVYVLDPERRTMRGLAERRALGRVDMEVPLDGMANVARAVEQREPVYFTRAETSGLETTWFERHGISATLALPMVANDRCIGVLFLNEYREPVPPTADELSFARGIAAHCAVAVTRAMTFEAERAARARAEMAEAAARRAARRLAISQDLTASLSSAHELAQIFDVIATNGLAAVGASTLGVSLLRDATLEVAGVFGNAEVPIAAGASVPLDAADPVAEVARTGQPLFVESIEALERRWPGAGKRSGRKGAWVGLPLVTDGQVHGVLTLCYDEHREFDLEERAFLASVARKCAQALDRARLFEAERAAREEAQRIGALQEQLIAIVGHDLRTPLSAISMAVGVLFRRGGLDEKQAQTLSRVASSSQRMANIIRDLLDFSRARQGATIPIALAPVDLREIVERVVLELQAAQPQREIRLHASGAANGQADPERFAQVVSNLVGNALQHGDPDGPVDVTVEGLAGELRVSVHNHGEPIPPDLLPLVFEPFRRGEPRRSESSVGLGLFIVREIVRAHAGSVEVRSEAGEGTTFTVRLPRR